MNKRYHGNQPRHKQQILHSIFSIITLRLSFLQLEDPRTQRNIIIAEFFVFQVNTDVAIHGDNAGLGGLIRDLSGKEVAAFSVKLPAKEIHVLEMKAILLGARLAAEKGLTYTLLESDSLTAVNVINDDRTCPWKAISVIADIRDALLCLDNWKLSNVWREANVAADFLSKPTCSIEGVDIPVVDLPIDLLDIIVADSNGTLYPRL
ncbi:uncharacterized protein LOC143861248 [Tasmannia lanceolata]|uniref:uncharacterized protein LOC143861248 n=1 Tax=Tasmannia lanceolata TaxID=3420 RepID=UPI004063BED5